MKKKIAIFVGLALLILVSGLVYYFILPQVRETQAKYGKRIEKIATTSKNLTGFWKELSVYRARLPEVASKCGREKQEIAIPDKFHDYLIEPNLYSEKELEALSPEELTNAENEQLRRTVQYLPLLKYLSELKKFENTCKTLPTKSLRKPSL